MLQIKPGTYFGCCHQPKHVAGFVCKFKFTYLFSIPCYWHFHYLLQFMAKETLTKNG